MSEDQGREMLQALRLHLLAGDTPGFTIETTVFLKFRSVWPCILGCGETRTAELNVPVPDGLTRQEVDDLHDQLRNDVIEVVATERLEPCPDCTQKLAKQTLKVN